MRPIPYNVAMDDPSHPAGTYSLFDLQSLLKSVITGAFADLYWVIAEIAEYKCNQRGHCYLELVEKKDDRTIAQAKGNIWAYEYRKIIQKFEAATGEPLRAGMKMLLLVGVNYHEVYGLSLNIRDIDPSYTMGEMALKKREVIARLAKEGLLDRNKSLPLPLVPLRIAVVSSPTAAGYGDFSGHLDRNPYGYRFSHRLFPALMQGQDAVPSIIAAMEKVRLSGTPYDMVALVRGGGSAADLSCFDAYELAAEIAGFPLPVISGIGHEKDDSVADLVSHTRMKTPTAVAEFIISGVKTFEETLTGIGRKILSLTGDLLRDQNYRIRAISQRLAHLPGRLIESQVYELALRERDIRSRCREVLLRADATLQKIGQAVRLLDPGNVLRRGFSITRHRGAVVRDASRLGAGDVITTQLHLGEVTSTISGQNRKEAKKKREQDKTTDLLPGFE